MSDPEPGSEVEVTVELPRLGIIAALDALDKSIRQEYGQDVLTQARASDGITVKKVVVTATLKIPNA